MCLGEKQGRRQRRVRWSRVRSRRKKKGSEEDDDEEEDEEEDESSSEEEEIEEDDSDEDYQVEKKKRRRNRNKVRNSSDSSTSSSDDLPPNDDPCKHCGLPNHPELVSENPICLHVGVGSTEVCSAILITEFFSDPAVRLLRQRLSHSVSPASSHDHP